MKQLVIIILTLVSCNYCPDIKPVSHANDYKLKYEIIGFDEFNNSLELKLYRTQSSASGGPNFLNDVDFNNYDVLYLKEYSNTQSRHTKGPPIIEININTKQQQINCYTYFQYEDCYGGVSSGLSYRKSVAWLKVPKLPLNYEVTTNSN